MIHYGTLYYFPFFASCDEHVAVKQAVHTVALNSYSMSLASKKDEENGLSTYYNNKTTIIQEARVFNDSPISPRKCRALLTRIVYLLYVGETFGTQEATTLFFGTTKLFQHKDVSIIYVACRHDYALTWDARYRVRCGRWFTWLSRSWRAPRRMS